MKSKVIKSANPKPETVISLQQKIKKLEIQIIRLQQKVLKLETVKLKQVRKIIKLQTEYEKLKLKKQPLFVTVKKGWKEHDSSSKD